MTTTQPPACGKISELIEAALDERDGPFPDFTYVHKSRMREWLSKFAADVLSLRHPAPVADERAAGGDALNDMNGKHAVDGISALLKDAEPLHRDAFEHLEPVPHIATLINNNQFGWTNIIETAPNVTIDVGTKLYDQKALFAVGVAMLEQGRKGGFEDGYIAGKAYQKHFASAPPPSSIPSATADATLRAALEKDAARLDWLERDMARGDRAVAIYFEDGRFRFPYLVSGAGGFGGGVGEHVCHTLREAIDAALAGKVGEK